MKETNRLRERCLALFIALCMVMAIPAAYAVVKNVTIVDAQGNSLANTKVTIVFPDGTEVEEETDDDGALIYDFPEDGDYTINYPGGQMAVSVSGGIPTWMWVAGGVAAAGVTWAVVDDDSDGGSSGSGSPSSCSEADGSYTITTSVVSNPGDHLTDEFNGDYQVYCLSSPDLSITGLSTAQPGWDCTLDSSGNCNSSPTLCSWGGFSTTCSLTSTFTEGAHTHWQGTMTAGDDGALPGGQSIEVQFNSSD